MYVCMYVCMYVLLCYAMIYSIVVCYIITLEVHARASEVHPVSITRFPLRRFSPGAGLLRYVFFIGSG